LSSIKQAIFESDREDFLKLFLPALLCVPFIFFRQIEFYAWMSVIFLSVMDISHVFSTGVEAYLDPEVRRERNTIKLTLIGISIALFIVVFFADIAQNIFFYSIIFHNMRQGIGLALIYYKKSEKKLISAENLKRIYYFLTLFPIVIFHLKRTYVDFGMLEKYYFVIPVEKFLTLSNYPVVSIVKSLEIFYLLAFVGLFFFIVRKVGQRSSATILFFALIYAFSYIGTDNLLFSSLLLMASHAVPYLFLIQKRTNKLAASEYMKRYSWIVIGLCVVLGFCYYFFFYRGIGPVEKMSPVAKFFVIVPSYIHYAFDGHVWTKNNERFLKFIRI
jgi:hypothetical protein